MSKKILIVDDSVFFREQINRVLLRAGYETVIAVDGENALELVDVEKPDLILLDVEMPGMNGFTVCSILRDSESNHLMPIIMLSAMNDLDDKLVGLELGADDYVTKPFNERELLSRIRNTLVRIERNRSANPLTGLPGNVEIQRELLRRIARGEPYAVVYSDLDNFKAFNDAYGFASGDLAIKLNADILKEQRAIYGNPEDFVGHIGGDDFVLITTPDKVDGLCQSIINEIDLRIQELFSPEDVARGGIVTINRRGEREIFPITSISLAVVTNEQRKFTSHLEISSVASELKKKLKSMAGSNFYKDKRKDEELQAVPLAE